MIREVKIKWQEIYYLSGVLKYEGFTKIDSRVYELIPYGQGIKFFEDGKKNMEVSLNYAHLLLPCIYAEAGGGD